ncbi:AraC family transcriptional regulator [Cohnella caldifontis]|uniref:AraC family transcriptional regulator n=1 Tax=Cohnella caldifontis TaxID=3027471 RepID=UPI0023EB6CD8|nr:AraC family transcriptional regulator [Cohnella sp. YIM B05605]
MEQERFFEEAKRELASVIDRFMKEDGTKDTGIPSLRMMRVSRPNSPVHAVYAAALCLVAQGAKTTRLGKESFRYDPSSFLITSVHLPVTSQVVEASPESPFLSLQLTFGIQDILDIAKNTDPSWDRSRETDRAIYVNRTHPLLLDAVLRLVRLVDTPADIPSLAPLYRREILYRIWQDEQGNGIKQFFGASSQADAVAKAIGRIRRDFRLPLRIEELAKEANLSPSSLHKHFKQVTAMSPLQYQKTLRLQEARRLLIEDSLAAAEAAFRVGYESPSQFNREYARMFGLPPIRDVGRAKDGFTSEALTGSYGSLRSPSFAAE